MSSPFLDYLNVQTIFSAGTMLAPVIKPLIEDLKTNIISPIAAKIYPSAATTAEDKKIKLDVFLKSLIKYLIMIAIMAFMWKIVKFLIISVTGGKK